MPSATVGDDAGAIVAVQATAPVVALAAYSFASSDPKYTSPSATTGDDSTAAPVWIVKRFVSVDTLRAVIVRSFGLNPVRSGPNRYCGKLHAASATTRPTPPRTRPCA